MIATGRLYFFAVVAATHTTNSQFTPCQQLYYCDVSTYSHRYTYLYNDATTLTSKQLKFVQIHLRHKY